MTTTAQTGGSARPRLGGDFYARDVVRVARALLGQRLVRVLDGRRLAGRIVEVEAYLGVPDLAAHTAGGRRTKRNETMWGPAGRAYVYLIYGMHCCLNVTAGAGGEPVAVLLRALAPEEGLGEMRRRRSAGRRGGGGALRDTDLCSGPGKLCAALGINRALDGADLVASGELFVERLRSRALPRRRIEAAPRIGVGYAGAWATRPLRFYDRESPHVSRR